MKTFSMSDRSERAFAPDIRLVYSVSLRRYRASSVHQIPLVRQVNGGDSRVTDIDTFTASAGKLGLTVETTGQEIA